MNVLHLGDRMMCRLPSGRVPFPVIVRGFISHDEPYLEPEEVYVEAVERSDDALVENEWHVPFSWLQRPLVNG